MFWGDHAGQIGQIIKERGNNRSLVLDIEKSVRPAKIEVNKQIYLVSSTFDSIWPHYTTSTYNQVVYFLLFSVPSSLEVETPPSEDAFPVGNRRFRYIYI